MNNLEDQFINLLIENLPEDKFIEYKILIELNNKEKMETFIKSILPDIEDILSKNLNRLT